MKFVTRVRFIDEDIEETVHENWESLEGELENLVLVRALWSLESVKVLGSLDDELPDAEIMDKIRHYMDLINGV